MIGMEKAPATRSRTASSERIVDVSSTGNFSSCVRRNRVTVKHMTGTTTIARDNHCYKQHIGIPSFPWSAQGVYCMLCICSNQFLENTYIRSGRASLGSLESRARLQTAGWDLEDSRIWQLLCGV